MTEKHSQTKQTGLYQNFQERIAEVVDEYLLLGADPDQIIVLLQQEAGSDLAKRREELGG